jgi:hypothetical protein
MFWNLQHLLKSIQQCLDMLDIGMMQIIHRQLMQWCLGISEHWNGSEHLLKLMVWCLIMSEHWNGLKHLLKLMVWCLGISEDWNGSEHPLKLILQCLDRLDI